METPSTQNNYASNLLSPYQNPMAPAQSQDPSQTQNQAQAQAQNQQQQSPASNQMGAFANPLSWLPACCTCRSTTKFCLLYFTTLVLITLIFTALNAEPLDEEQAPTWWAFVISLLVVGSLSCFVLFIIFYIDCRRPTADPNVQDQEQSKGQARVLIDDSQSASNKSFKTILTIESKPQDSGNAIKTIGLTPVSDQYTATVQMTRPGDQMDPTAFKQPMPSNDPVPISPAKSPVTVVDMQAMRKALPKTVTKSYGAPAKQVAEAANMGTIPSITLVSDQDAEAPKPLKVKKKKRKKDKKVATKS